MDEVLEMRADLALWLVGGRAKLMRHAAPDERREPRQIVRADGTREYPIGSMQDLTAALGQLGGRHAVGPSRGVSKGA